MKIPRVQFLEPGDFFFFHYSYFSFYCNQSWCYSMLMVGMLDVLLRSIQVNELFISLLTELVFSLVLIGMTLL